jgi:hypothetical protein
MRFSLVAILLFFSASPLFAQIFGRDYNPGAYYTTDGQRHEGLLAMDLNPPSIFSSRSDNTLYFKPDSNTKRVKIKASTLMSFVVSNKDTARTDSFVVIHQPEHSRIKYDYDFIQVIFNNGPVKLYNYKLPRAAGGGLGFGAISVGLAFTYYDNYYFYGENANSSLEMKRKDFKDVMSKMLADDPEIVTMIMNKKYTIGDMHVMLKRYNATRVPGAAQQAPPPSAPPAAASAVVKD